MDNHASAYGDYVGFHTMITKATICDYNISIDDIVVVFSILFTHRITVIITFNNCHCRRQVGKSSISQQKFGRELWLPNTEPPEWYE